MKPLILIAAGSAALVAALLRNAPSEVLLSSYSTPLEGRVLPQRQNAYLALSKLDGFTVGAGETFSFNNTVGTWSRDEGYRKAPVSFNGQLVWTWGGGVCQTSSTLYNTALLAGMNIKERNRHRFSPGYVAPGRDAAVAFSNIDLSFQNPYPFPITIRAKVQNSRLVCEIWGAEKPAEGISIQQELLEKRKGAVFVERAGRSGRVMNPGKFGYTTAIYRIFSGPKGRRREVLSYDVYPPMNRVVQRPS